MPPLPTHTSPSPTPLPLGPPYATATVALLCYQKFRASQIAKRDRALPLLSRQHIQHIYIYIYIWRATAESRADRVVRRTAESCVARDSLDVHTKLNCWSKSMGVNENTKRHRCTFFSAYYQPPDTYVWTASNTHTHTQTHCDYNNTLSDVYARPVLP